eukprot:m.353593 g.353593  ORF g.353593 m.353593 type:complete len:345 (-) comp19906_c3_seq9:131-1165(-)
MTRGWLPRSVCSCLRRRHAAGSVVASAFLASLNARLALTRLVLKSKTAASVSRAFKSNACCAGVNVASQPQFVSGRHVATKTTFANSTAAGGCRACSAAASETLSSNTSVCLPCAPSASANCQSFSASPSSSTLPNSCGERNSLDARLRDAIVAFLSWQKMCTTLCMNAAGCSESTPWTISRARKDLPIPDSPWMTRTCPGVEHHATPSASSVARPTMATSGVRKNVAAMLRAGASGDADFTQEQRGTLVHPPSCLLMSSMASHRACFVLRSRSLRSRSLLSNMALSRPLTFFLHFASCSGVRPGRLVPGSKTGVLQATGHALGLELQQASRARWCCAPLGDED